MYIYEDKGEEKWTKKKKKSTRQRRRWFIRGMVQESAAGRASIIAIQQSVPGNIIGQFTDARDQSTNTLARQKIK